MWCFLLILLFSPAAVQASCAGPDPAYALAVSQGDYQTAFERVSQEIHLRPEEKRRFQIIRGFSRSHDDRNGQANPESLEVRLDPGLFIEGKEGACQGIAHEVTHLRQFQRDRRRLHIRYSTDPRREEDAYDSLEDNDLAVHAAAMDIEAVLAQLPYATGHTLRDDDFSYLVENLNNWSDHASELSNPSNQNYYFPEIKNEDIRIFCQGAEFARKNLANTESFQQAWLAFCRTRH